MEQCSDCKANCDLLNLKKCCKCGVYLCADCSYYAHFWRVIADASGLEAEMNEEGYFCKSHFIVYISSLTPAVLEDMLKNHFVTKGSYEEGDKKISFTREFRGKDLEETLRDTIAPWPSDEWKDWNTM